MSKTNKDGYSYIDGNYVKSNQPEVIVVRKPVIKESKETPKKGWQPLNERVMYKHDTHRMD